ncbi:cysteine hydrolase family protein [Polyangium mundeleinium]|uniref:Cysteine hydrolase n=1 Tax=Polyangium mundeleinium TaxID=2995306 RepID=A0ABT5EGW6_9BACT|nr:isochorismatase family cysteine hydrolase [Polyangium mundeleinium]MDC0740006.1 cysteine hydrolase [Polyangium mundeleinium]
MKPALLVIDVQKQFFDESPETARSLTNAIEYINAGIALFRAKGLPVVCVQDIGEEDQRVPGTTRFEVPESVKVLPSDLHIHKTYGNSFNKTPLAGALRELDVDTVILTGYCAEHCVLSTYRGALDHDFTPVILRGSLASGVAENIPFVERIGDVISYGALKRVLG